MEPKCGARGRGMDVPPRARAVSGLRSEALGPPARSWLTAWVLREPRPKARPGCRKTPQWRAERRHTFARRCALNERLRRLARHPLILEGDGNRRRPTRGRKETGDDACSRIPPLK